MVPVTFSALKMICTRNQSAKWTVLISVRIHRTHKQNTMDSLLIKLNFAEVLQVLLQLMHFFVGDKISGRLGKNITPYAKLLFHLYVNITLRVVVVVDCSLYEKGTGAFHCQR